MFLKFKQIYPANVVNHIINMLQLLKQNFDFLYNFSKLEIKNNLTDYYFKPAHAFFEDE